MRLHRAKREYGCQINIAPLIDVVFLLIIFFLTVSHITQVRVEALSYGASRRFDLKPFKVKVGLPQDKKVTFEFVADKPGEFVWKCGRPCGNGCAKMTGTLIVE